MMRTWFLMFFSIFSSSLFSEGVISTFYKNQNYENFKLALQNFSQTEDQTENLNEKQGNNLHVLYLSGIFLGHVLNQHPEYLDRFMKLESPPAGEKFVLAHAVALLGKKDHPIVHQVQPNKIRIVDKSIQDFDNAPISTTDEINFAWVSYYATGDSLYIKKVLQAITRDEGAFVIACELDNRIAMQKMLDKAGVTQDLMTDLEETIKKTEKENPGFSEQVVVANLAKWSFESNRKSDDEIGTKAQAIVDQNPKLNYMQITQKYFHSHSTTPTQNSTSTDL